jgi:hypothetical protein
MAEETLKEKTSRLIGQDIVLAVDGPISVKLWARMFKKLYGVRVFEHVNDVPEDLLLYMNNHGLLHGILHAVTNDDKSIIPAFKAGKNLVVLRRGYDIATPGDLASYAEIEKAGIPVISRDPYENRDYTPEAILSTLLQVIEKRKSC